MAFSVCLASALASGQDISRNRDVSFQLSGVSVWQNGQGVNQSISLGPQWSKSGSVGKTVDVQIPSFTIDGFTFPAIDLGNFGASIGYNLSAGFGFTAGINYTGGTANIEADGDIVFSFDREPQSGMPCNVTVSYAPRSTSNFTTTSPQLSSTLEWTAGFEAALTASAEAFGEYIIPANTDIFSYTQPDSGFTGHYQILNGALENLNSNAAIQAINATTPLGVVFQSPDNSATGSLVSGSEQMTGSGFQPFVTFSTILSQLLLSFVSGDAAQKLSEVLDGSTTIAGLTASWNLAEVEGNFGLGLRDQYTFDPQPHVSFSVVSNATGQTIQTFNDVALGSTVQFTMPATGGVTVNPTCSPQPTLENKVTTAANGGYDITPFDISLSGSIGIGSYSKSFNWEFDPWSYDWTSQPASFLTIDDRTATYTVQSQTLTPIMINPANPTSPTAEIFGDFNSTQQYAQAPAYNGYTYGSDDVGPYTMDIYPLQGFGFCGIDSGDAASIAFQPISWDGQNPTSAIPTGSGNSPAVALSTGTRDELQINLNWGLLRPGNHTLVFSNTALFQGVSKTTQYDLPVTVPLPTIGIDGGLMSGTSDQAFQVNDINSSYTGQPIFFQGTNALLESQVILDNGIVLPTTKYINGQAVTTQGTDPNRKTYTNNQEYQWYTSGNNVMSFTIPPEIVQQLAGTMHTVALQTKDPFSSGYVVSTVSNAANQTLYFPAGAPTIKKISYDGLTSNFPILSTGYSLRVDGTNFTPSTTATMTIGSNSYPMTTSFVNPTQLEVAVPTSALDDEQNSEAAATITVTTTPFSLTSPQDFTGELAGTVKSGGSATGSATFIMPKPVVTDVSPGSPVRGLATQLTVNGMYFSQGNTTDAQTQVTFGGITVPSNEISFPSGNRGLTSMLLNLPATALAKAGPQVLQVQSTGGTSKYTVTISNAAPQIATSPALSVRVGGTGPNPQLLLNGGLFYSDTKANLGSGGAQIQSQTATTLTLNVPNLEVPSTTVSVTNETPGGGTSNQVPVTILEGDVNTLTLTRGSAIFNPLAHTYTQSFSIGYKGQRTMQGTVAVEFQLPHGVQLVSSNLIMNGLPTQLVKVNMLKGGTTNFVAVFKTNQTTLPNFTTSMAIEN